MATLVQPSIQQRRDAAWVARSLGRAGAAPVPEATVESLAWCLERRSFRRGDVLFLAGRPQPGVWIVRDGVIELAAGPSRRRAVMKLVRSGDIEGDVALMLDKPTEYEARALSDVTCVYLDRGSFNRLLKGDPVLARGWLTSCLHRLDCAHGRILELLGASLAEQVAGLILDEAIDGSLRVPQRTLAAMLGVRRQSLNKTLKELELAGVVRVAYAGIDVLDERGLQLLTGRPRS